MSNVALFPLSDSHAAPTDQELINRTLEGEGAAFGILVERYQRRVFRVAYAIVRDDSEADGITQDAFVQAFTNLAKFRGRSEFETWLTRIAINRSRDVLRQRRRVGFFTSREDADGNELTIEPVDERPDPERQIIALQLRAAIQRAETKLSAQQKLVFRLRHYENLSLENIAEHLGLRSGTVRAHLFRAIHKIRKELASWRSRGVQGNDDETSLH